MSDFITNAELRIEAERLCDENEKLRDDNARLRSCLSDDAENARMIMGENAQLRELVCDMLHWMPCHRPCQRCERYRYPEGCEFEIRRRKLGIEVKE